MMKKIVKFILIFCTIIFLFGSCEVGVSKEAELEKGAIVYSNLNKIGDDCNAIIEAIEDAWYFSIYKADNYYSANSIISAFSEYTGIYEYNVKAGVEDYLGSDYYSYSSKYSTDAIYCAMLSEVDCAVSVVTYSVRGSLDKMHNLLNDAQQYLKDMSDKYDSDTQYSNLKKYYSEIKSFLDFCTSPTGSYSELGTTKRDFKENTKRYKNELSIIYN